MAITFSQRGGFAITTLRLTFATHTHFSFFSSIFTFPRSDGFLLVISLFSTCFRFTPRFSTAFSSYASLARRSLTSL